MTWFAVIAGGGTSGHVLPALATAESLIDAGHEPSSIAYFGATRGIETSLVPPTGLAHEFFDVVGVKREISLSAIRNNLRFLPCLIRSRRRAIEVFRREMPRVVVSVGGYASLPAVLAARACNVPIVVISYDRRPGRASQWSARWAACSAVAYPESDLPRSQWTGAPVRRAIRLADRSRDRDSARTRFGVEEDQFFVGVIGGSLGSAVLNEAIAEYVRSHSSDRTLSIRHVVGPRFYDSDAETTKASSTLHREGVDYVVVPYEDDMVSLYSAVDLLVGRGGAGTVAEVATVGVPSILVPWDGAADDHQRENVRWLSDEGAALLVSESDIATDLAPAIEGLRHDPERRRDLGNRAREMGERNRSNRIAEVIDAVASRGGNA